MPVSYVMILYIIAKTLRYPDNYQIANLFSNSLVMNTFICSLLWKLNFQENLDPMNIMTYFLTPFLMSLSQIDF